MTVYSGQFFFLGNFAEADTDEADYDLENGVALLGTAMLPSLVTVDLDDTNDDVIVEDDDVDGSPDTVGYDLGGGSVTTTLDSSSVYNAIVTYGDTSTSTVQLIVMQMTNGDVFVNDLTSGDLDNQTVFSINLTSEASSNYSGITPSTFVTGASTAVCFAKGTMIETACGNRAVEKLRPGDLLPTRSGEALPIHWITRRHHRCPGRHAPICIPTNAIAPDVPRQELRLSPQHRVLVSSPIVQRMCKSNTALIPAKALLELPEVYQASEKIAVEYHHILLSSHHIITANGVPAETLFLGREVRNTLPRLMFEGIENQIAVAPIMTTSKGRSLVRRHLKNHKSLWQSGLRRQEAAPLPLHPSIRAFARQYSPEPAGFIQ